MHLLDINEDIDSYIKDIKEITCLLLEESGQYRFIHNTVQDYYSASFIKSLPEPSVVKFYEACLDQSRAKNWLLELHFLLDIDPYRHTKYFILSQCSKAMGYEHELDRTFLHPEEISLDRTRNILGNWQLSLSHDKDDNPYCSSIYFGDTLAFWGRRAGDISTHDLFSCDYTQVMANIVSGKIAINNSKPPTITDATRIKITANQILDAGLLTIEFKSIAQKFSLDAYGQWQQAIAYLDRKDALIKTLDII